jgi:hypothetical protein
MSRPRRLAAVLAGLLAGMLLAVLLALPALAGTDSDASLTGDGPAPAPGAPSAEVAPVIAVVWEPGAEPPRAAPADGPGFGLTVMVGGLGLVVLGVAGLARDRLRLPPGSRSGT